MLGKSKTVTSFCFTFGRDEILQSVLGFPNSAATSNQATNSQPLTIWEVENCQILEVNMHHLPEKNIILLMAEIRLTS